MSPPSKLNHMPQHVAIIMDGNGRWAKKHHLPRLEGHRRGARSAQRCIETCIDYAIPYLTLYAFSTENWNRPRIEVEGILKLLEESLDEGITYAMDKGIKVRHLGKIDRLPDKIKDKIHEVTERTGNNIRLTLGLAFNYGGRDEIVGAVQRIIQGGISSQSVKESTVSSYLYTNDIPDPDLIIRTGGEKRLSNFLLWQAAYAEIYFTDVLWPDFNRSEIDKALLDFNKRQRRFGKLGEE
jgi:undecaprenyl diphosphate synthase